MFEVLLSHLQDVVGIGKEDIAPLPVACHILVLALLESVQLMFVITLYPTCLIEREGFPAALGAILVFQSVLDDLELQLTYGSDDLPAIELVDE